MNFIWQLDNLIVPCWIHIAWLETIKEQAISTEELDLGLNEILHSLRESSSYHHMPFEIEAT